MVQSRLKTVGALTAIGLTLYPLAVFAQQAGSPEWFVPGQQRPAAPGPARPGPRAAPAPTSMAPGFGNDAAGQNDEAPIPRQQIQVQLPPPPEIPPVPKGSAPPAAIVGILSVPDVLRLSAAYQAADKELAVRRQKLNEDAQKEQVALRDLGQALTRERAKMTPEQIRAKEREYEDRVNEARRKFGERNRIIQEAGQYVMAQVDRTLEQVAQQVALSRGVNLVLNRAQLLGTSTDFDLTPQVADVLNKALPTVVIPPDGMSVLSMVPSAGTQGPGGISTAPGAPEPVAGTTPASAPLQAAPAQAAPAATPAATPTGAKPPHKR